MAMGTLTFKNKQKHKSIWEHQFAQKISHPSAFSIEFCVCRVEIMADGDGGGTRGKV